MTAGAFFAWSRPLGFAVRGGNLLVALIALVATVVLIPESRRTNAQDKTEPQLVARAKPPRLPGRLLFLERPLAATC